MDITGFKKSRSSDKCMGGLAAQIYGMADLSLTESARALKALSFYKGGHQIDAVHLQLPPASAEALRTADAHDEQPRVDNVGHICLLVNYARDNFPTTYGTRDGLADSLDSIAADMPEQGKINLYLVYTSGREDVLDALKNKGFQPNT